MPRKPIEAAVVATMSKELRAELEALAHEREVPMAHIIREALKAYLPTQQGEVA